MKSFFQKTSFFDISLRILLILLPFTTLLTVWTKEVVGISGFGFYKEILLVIMLISIGWHHIRGHLKIAFTHIDIVILMYIVSMIIVTLFTTGLPGLIYGGRYDFAFLLAFWIIYHGYPLLGEGVSYYIRIFLISGGIMLFLSALLKWPLTEDILLSFGFCGNPSNWQSCNGVPPIFHGIDGANVRRFQGILDGPNTMGAFVIMYAGIFTYYMRMKRDWYFITGGLVLGFFILIVYTYSRSALLGALAGIFVAVVLSIRPLYTRYRTQFLSLIAICILLIGGLYVKYRDNSESIIGREGSTKGHFERMVTSIERFREYPMGQGLGSSGPAYRHIIDVDASNMEEKDRFYIPESWYIQQFVEGGTIGGLLFLVLMLTFWIMLLQKSAILGGMFVGIGVMNVFLHTFESSILALPFFLLIGLILADTKHKRKNNL